jgi:hypothetical protein
VNGFAGSPLGVTLEIMPDRPATGIVFSSTHLTSRYLATAGAALLMTVMAASVAWPQSAPPPSSQPSAQSSPPGTQPPAPQAPPDGSTQGAPAPPPPEDNPGLIHEMGKLFEKSLSILPTIKSPSEAIDDLNARAKDAGDSLSRFAKPASMATGRIGCPVAANGAPDCKAGADKLCQTKGFKEGKSLNTDSAEKCSAKVYMPGYKREPGDCHTEYFVTRALCQ